jgi:hypothetical protein
MADTLKYKHDKLHRASPSMALQIDMDRWADEVAEAIDKRFRNISTEDIAGAVQAHNAQHALSSAYSGPWITSTSDWIGRAVAARESELEMIPDGDWVVFDRTATGRHMLVDGFPKSRGQLISAEREWTHKTTIASLRSIQMNPKLMREKCYETEKQLLALNSVDESPERFREARTLLFRTALHSAQSEIQSLLETGRVDVAYGIARKLAVDWFATAEILGPEQLKRLEELRDRCRDQVELADQSGELPELAPIPRTSETAPAPRLKQ